MSTVRSEEHTSELQSPCNLVCRLLLEKKQTDKHSRAAPRRGPSSLGARMTGGVRRSLPAVWRITGAGQRAQSRVLPDYYFFFYMMRHPPRSPLSPPAALSG